MDGRMGGQMHERTERWAGNNNILLRARGKTEPTSMSHSIDEKVILPPCKHLHHRHGVLEMLIIQSMPLSWLCFEYVSYRLTNNNFGNKGVYTSVFVIYCLSSTNTVLLHGLKQHITCIAYKFDPGAGFTKDILPTIQIRWKLCLALIPLLAIRLQQIFAHATTTQLSWHVQIL